MGREAMEQAHVLEIAKRHAAQNDPTAIPMTDDDRIELMQASEELWARIQPLEDRLRPLQVQLDALTSLIVADVKKEYLYFEHRSGVALMTQKKQ